MAAPAETGAAQGEKAEIGSLEVNGEFILKAGMPEGYDIVSLFSDTQMSVWMISDYDDGTRPTMFLQIAFDEAYADVARLNDLSEEDLSELLATWTMEYDGIVSFPETAYGTKLIQFVENGDYIDFVSIFTLYQGYCIEFDMIPAGDTDESLTREQIDLCIRFLSDMDFIPIEAE